MIKNGIHNVVVIMSKIRFVYSVSNWKWPTWGQETWQTT